MNSFNEIMREARVFIVNDKKKPSLFFHVRFWQSSCTDDTFKCRMLHKIHYGRFSNESRTISRRIQYA